MTLEVLLRRMDRIAGGNSGRWSKHGIGKDPGFTPAVPDGSFQ
jgi:hypothetical protein